MVIDPQEDLLDAVAAVAATRSRDAPGRLDPAALRAFIGRYFALVSHDDLELRDPHDLAGAVLAHLRLGAVRAPGETLVVVHDPTPELDGWTTPHTVIDIVADDVAYLVDGVAIVLARHAIGSHLRIHPIEHVVRRADGAIDAFVDADAVADAVADAAPGAVPDAVAEAWIHVEIERQPASVHESLRHELAAMIDDTQAIERDAPAMRQRAIDLAADLRADAAADENREAIAAAGLLEWLADGHFLFLAAREYRVVEEPTASDTAATLDHDTDGRMLRAVEGTGLGLLREELRPPTGTRLSRMRRDQRRRFEDDEPIVFTKDTVRSTVVRADYFEYIGLKMFAPDGTVIGERRFLGLFDESVYRQSIFDIPYLAAKAEAVIEASGLPTNSHSGRELIDTLEVFPRDELFQIDVPELQRIAMGITRLQERKQVRLFARRDRFGRFVSCLVYVPRDRFSTTAADRIVELLRASYGGTSTEHDNRVTERILARVHVLVRLADDAPDDVDDELVEQQLAALTRWWIDDVRDELVARFGETDAVLRVAAALDAFPAAYREAYAPVAAVADLAHMEQLGPERRITTSLERAAGDAPGEWRLKLYALDEPLALSSVLPLLENLGVRVIDERPYHLKLREPVWLHDLGLSLPAGTSLDDDRTRAEFQRAFVLLWDGTVENDAANALVLRGGLTTDEIVILRAVTRYLRQVGLPFTPAYVDATLNAHPDVARALVALFVAKFDPARLGSADDAENRVQDVVGLLGGVASLDEDRILRSVLGVIDAMTRTNAFRRANAPDVPCSAALSFKLDPSKVPDLPRPRPMYEIWVYSPLVEGVHLRGGPIARGGLRWSDRREDFRTEVLGLMKAQMVKNAVIVPVGAKGGFSPKQLPADAAARKAAVVECYETYVAALLDLTDNLVGGEVVPPGGVVRHDGDDPYLVVAADKGTATFSDTANAIAARYGFWLGDAFASGGSVGYDHKVMGITARGAWESVRRHFRMLGIDADRDPITAVGIGDMSGDVFGNGMLLSRSLHLVAAFDHRHVFIDPTPDAAASFAERTRLFALPGSSWDDYDRSIISTGGGVWPRSAKSIPLSPEMQSVLGVDDAALSPLALISAILRAPVDLLWNGGIGTYVKASTESHAEVGDRANDALRVDASTLRCRVVAEGGNLGLTQRGRIEFALTGGLINTDAIDNSAGVDCSDHEVNIKIALDAVVQRGELSMEQRNELLASMTDEVGELVLDDNRAQNLALAIARTQSVAMADVHGRQIRTLELAGQIDRRLEFLPDEKTLAERHAAGRGLTAPEFSVLLAYTKGTTVEAVLASDLPDDPYVGPELIDYFPLAMHERFVDAMRAHPLRRQIVGTRLANDVVNHAGLSFEHRMAEETSASTSEIIRAHIVARDVFELHRQWSEIDALGSAVDPAHQLELFVTLRRLVERSTRWLLRHRRAPLDLQANVDAFRPGVRELTATFPDLLVGSFSDAVRRTSQRSIDAGVPVSLAQQAAGWPYLHTALDVVELADRRGCSVTDAARVYWTLFERLDLTWMWEQISLLPRTDRWRNQARAALRDDLLTGLRTLCADALATDGALTGWLGANEEAISRVNALYADIRSHGVFDLATLTVALRQLRNLTLSGTD